MDSVTQFVLGAAVGEVIAGRKVGNKALWIGGLAGTIPDLDVIPGQWMQTVTKLEFHRGPSHSIFFAILAAPVFGWLTAKIWNYFSKSNNTDWRNWSWLYFWGFFTHALLDCCTTWGTQLFWPFSEYAVAWQNIFVVDPIYTIPLIIAFLWLHFLHKESRQRQIVLQIGLLLSHLYLALTFMNGLEIERMARRDLLEREMVYDHLAVRPAPFQNLLWGAVARKPDGNFLVSYFSFMDRNSHDWLEIQHGPELPNSIQSDSRIQRLLRITQGLYTIEKLDNGYRINDLRFGRMFDWFIQWQGKATPPEIYAANRFIFSYDIETGRATPDAAKKVLRITQNRAGSDQYSIARKTIGFFLERISGI